MQNILGKVLLFGDVFLLVRGKLGEKMKNLFDILVENGEETLEQLCERSSSCRRPRDDLNFLVLKTINSKNHDKILTKYFHRFQGGKELHKSLSNYNKNSFAYELLLNHLVKVTEGSKRKKMYRWFTQVLNNEDVIKYFRSKKTFGFSSFLEIVDKASKKNNVPEDIISKVAKIALKCKGKEVRELMWPIYIEIDYKKDHDILNFLNKIDYPSVYSMLEKYEGDFLHSISREFLTIENVDKIRDIADILNRDDIHQVLSKEATKTMWDAGCYYLIKAAIILNNPEYIKRITALKKDSKNTTYAIDSISRILDGYHKISDNKKAEYLEKLITIFEKNKKQDLHCISYALNESRMGPQPYLYEKIIDTCYSLSGKKVVLAAKAFYTKFHTFENRHVKHVYDVISEVINKYGGKPERILESALRFAIEFMDHNQYYNDTKTSKKTLMQMLPIYIQNTEKTLKK